MSTAAQRVFGIPELLEQILLYVYDSEVVPYFWNLPSVCVDMDEDHYSDVPPSSLDFMKAVKRLFILQRVNESFDGTIHGSCNLRRRMGLEYAHKKEVNLVWENDLRFFWLDFLNTTVDTVEISGDDNDTLRVTLELPINPPRAQPPIILPSISLPPPSWQKVKITKIEMPIQVRIHVLLSSLTITSRPAYEELLEFDAGQGTLGDVDTMIKELRSRSVAKHWLLANGDRIHGLALCSGIAVAFALVLKSLGINLVVVACGAVERLCEIVERVVAEFGVRDPATCIVFVVVPTMSLAITKLLLTALDWWLRKTT